MARITSFGLNQRLIIFQGPNIVFIADYYGWKWRKLIAILKRYKAGKTRGDYVHLNLH